MRPHGKRFLIAGLLALALAPLAAQAQPPDDDNGRRGGPPPGGNGNGNLPGANADDLIARMMEFDANSDGKLSRAEVTDERLQRLFDRADANKDKVVTPDEIRTLATKESAANGNGRRGGPGGGGPGGPGGPGMMGGRPRPGEVLPGMLRQRLKLTAKQEKQVADLQKDVDAKLAKILTSAQKAQLKQMREQGPPPGGPGGFGPGGPPPDGEGPGGPPPGGGFGGPGGPPPGGDDMPPPPGGRGAGDPPF